MSPVLRIAINALAFNLGWFACVLASRWGAPLAAAPVVGVIVALHLALTPTRDRAREALAVSLIAGLGIVIDSAMLGAGVLGFRGSHAVGPVFVIWIGAFWFNFACTLGVALRWLRGRSVLAAVLGVASAPGTYYFGSVLGALELHERALVWSLALGIEWGVVLPFISWAQGRLTRRETGLGASESAGSAPEGTPRP